jgi:hypothetical protein
MRDIELIRGRSGGEKGNNFEGRPISPQLTPHPGSGEDVSVAWFPKSSVTRLRLQGLLGEARRTGDVRLPWGQVAYCSQQAWLNNASVRDNITFGKPFDEAWFRQVQH